MTNAFVSPYWSIFETRMVNREDVLQEIHQALEDLSGANHIFYITGGGGYGKTKLLRTVLEKVQGGDWVSRKILAPEEPVDLYHISTRSQEGLAQQIARRMDTQRKNTFQLFEAKRKDFARKKYQIKGSYRDITEQREALMQAFLDDYELQCNTFDRILLALDTAETWRLLEDSDRFQQIQNQDYPRPGSYRWALHTLLPKIRKSVVLIAGRPHPEDPEKDILLQELRVLASQRQDIVFHPVPLQPFSLTDSLAYFDAVYDIARDNHLEVAALMDGIDVDMRQTIHHLTGGEPLLLAMTIDYLAQTRKVADLFQIDASEAQQRAGPDTPVNEARDAIQIALMEGIQAGNRPLDQVIEPLSWLRKGMNAAMLAWIETGDEPSAEELAQAEEKIRTLLDEKNRLTFIKIRPDDNRLFLHDELYDLYERIHRNYSPLRRKGVYNRLEKYYQHAIKEKRAEISALKLELLQKVLADLNAYGEIKIGAFEDLELMEKQAAMEALLVEHVFYTFLWDPKEGFRRYILYAEEAFQSLDEEFWIELLDELKKFRNVRQVWGYGPTEEELEGEIGVGWIRYAIMEMRYSDVLRQAALFEEKCPDLFHDSPLLAHRLNVWKGQAMVYLAESKDAMRDAERLLKQTISALSKQPVPKDDFEDRLTRTAKAEAEVNLGYLYRTWGRFNEAIPPYRRALIEYRYLKNEAGQANTLNNLAWAEAEDGKFELALFHCNDGLKLRRKSSTSSLYAVALSLNTRGLIKTRTANATDAEEDNKLALLIFKGLEELRGIGLANTALSEAIRRGVTDTDLDTPAKIRSRLLEAEGYAKEAVQIFEHTLKEPLRMAEALLELGCVYRELARFTSDDLLQRNDWFDCGRTALERAAETAHNKFEYRAYDALVNLAFLYYYASRKKQAKDLFMNAVYAKIDPRYYFAPKKGIPRLVDQISWYWVQLGKGFSLLGRIAFDDYQQAKEDKDFMEAEKLLDEAVKNWFLSLEYNARYGKSFRDMTRSKARIYEGITTLNTDEQRRALQTALMVNEEYRIKINKEQAPPLFIELLEDGFGLSTAWPHPLTQE
jgi:hypothetical protein